MAVSAQEVELQNLMKGGDTEKQPYGETTIVISEDAQENDITLVLLGKTGSGKSETVNTIAGKTITDTKSSTITCQLHEEVVYGYNLKIVDTPGFYSLKVGNEEIFQSITAILNKISSTTITSPVFLIVLKPGRFTDEEFLTINMINEIVKQHKQCHSFILFTHKDDLEADELTIDEYLADADDSLKTIVSELGHGYFIMNNRADMEIRKKEAKILLDQLWVYVQPDREPFYKRYPKHLLSYLRTVLTSIYYYIRGTET